MGTLTLASRNFTTAYILTVAFLTRQNKLCLLGRAKPLGQQKFSVSQRNLWSHLAKNILSFLEIGDFPSCELVLLFPDFG